MTANEYAGKLRKAAEVIEANQAEVLYGICYDHYGITLVSFLRIFAGQAVRKQINNGTVELQSTVDGIRFYAYQERPQPKELSEVTLPRLTTEEIEL